MANKISSRKRRATRTRALIARQRKVCLTIHRTPRHIYAQVISPDQGKVLAVASTVEKAIREPLRYTGNIEAAQAVGRMIAERALAAGVKEVAFDRSGFKYHGRVKALADAAREGGMNF